MNSDATACGWNSVRRNDHDIKRCCGVKYFNVWQWQGKNFSEEESLDIEKEVGSGKPWKQGCNLRDYCRTFYLYKLHKIKLFKKAIILLYLLMWLKKIV